MEQKVKALFAAHPDGKQKAAEIAALYLAAGMPVAESKLDGFAENRQLAEQSGMSHLLYFQDAKRITMVSFLDEMGGFTVDLLVSDLQLPKK
ncbi:MAG TPA: hypothetical protein H9733_07065 [Candidatus Anaerotignum merdipullorum]|nr:hypothetical protein [Candidatus Anaerotignum merdipullorum]